MHMELCTKELSYAFFTSLSIQISKFNIGELSSMVDRVKI